MSPDYPKVPPEFSAAYPDCPVSLINRENMTEFVQGMGPQIDM